MMLCFFSVGIGSFGLDRIMWRVVVVWNVDFMLCLDSFSLRLFTDALDVGEIDSADWFRFFFSWLVVVFVLLFKMPLSSGFVN